MKKLFLSTALLLQVCTLATAQGKTQFGLTVQTGNYLQARQEHQANDYLTTSYRLTGGVLVGLGAYAQRALCKHVALYNGLNFSQSAFTEQLTNAYPDQEKRAIGTGSYKQIRQVTVRQVALPVQLQLRAGANRQISFSIGAAPSFTVTKIRTDPEYQSAFSPYGLICGDATFYGAYELEDPSRFQVLFTTGLHYRPDAKNALGLELWLVPKAKGAEVDSQSYGYYSYNMPGQSYRMRSLQVSLRHSWQR